MRPFLVTSFITTWMALTGCSALGEVNQTAVASEPMSLVFSSEAGCMSETDIPTCDVILCDFLPEEKTFEETCEANYQKGFSPIGPDAPSIEWSEFLTDRLASCEISVAALEDDGRWRFVFGADAATARVKGIEIEVLDAIGEAREYCDGRFDQAEG